MRIHIYAPIHFYEWDFRAPDTTGIGGSETCVIETARRLAKRGHLVTVYAPIPKDCSGNDGGVPWLPLKAADFNDEGLWIIHRSPEVADKFKRKKDQQLWLICQDVNYTMGAGRMNADRAAIFDVVMPLCNAQASHFRSVHPWLRDKMVLSSNGIKREMIEEVENEGHERNPYRLIWTSSPDRGLLALLDIFRRVREIVPDIELRVAYGMDNIAKLARGRSHWGSEWRKVKAEVERGVNQPGVTWLGRLPQRELCREYFQAGVWCYPTHFSETSCISAQEAQACGAIPITNPFWAVGENVQHGIFIQGDPQHDPLTRARYEAELFSLVTKPGLQGGIRLEMMPWARDRFDWERVIDGYEAVMANPPKVPEAPEGIVAPGVPEQKVVGYLDHANGKVHKPADMSRAFEILVTSVKRPVNYIGRCLKPLSGWNVQVFPDCDPEYLDGLPVKVHPWDERGLVDQSNLSKSKRAGMNYCRVLRHGEGTALILEDDAVLRKGWDERLPFALEAVREHAFILALAHEWHWAFPKNTGRVRRFDNPIFRREGAIDVTVSVWSGTPAVFYCGIDRKALADFIEKDQRDLPDTVLYDQCIGRWALANDVPVYLCTPPLAKHIGRRSSIEWAGKRV